MNYNIDWGELGGDLALGTLIGLAIGFVFKKSIKVILFFLGFTVMLLLILQNFGFINIAWQNIEEVYQLLFLERGGFEKLFQNVIAWFAASIPLGGSFALGFLLGFRAG